MNGESTWFILVPYLAAGAITAVILAGTWVLLWRDGRRTRGEGEE
ncbi:MAG TPA: hypothetical protein VGC92_08395 [Phenylobacterium sp.]|jgi:hypothetical protein